MKKNLYKFFGLCQHYIDRTNVIKEDKSEPDVVETPLKAVLDEIFSIDPRSGFPKGDIAYFLSKDGNPEVKAWLESNLLQPRRQVSATPDGVTDELLAEFSRQPGEEPLDYAARLASLRDEAMKNYEEAKKKLNANENKE